MKRIRFKVGNRHFFAGTSKQHQMTGVNSRLRDDKGHFLMWDFDDTEEGTVRVSLIRQRWTYGLPAIHILQSSERGFHAYCFKRCTFAHAVSIIGGTQGVDGAFFKLGVLRGYFTLRITDKRHGIITPCHTLASQIEADVDPYNDIESTSEYWTAKG